MVRINEISGVYGPGKIKKTRKSDGTGFDGFLSAAEESETTASTASTAPVADISPLLSLQEVSDEEGRRQKSLQQGRQSLEMLDQLRREILSGQANAGMIQRMQRQVEQIRQNTPPGPRLQEIMNDIELRLAVEAAKLEKINVSA